MWGKFYVCVCLGAESREESQQDGVQRRESPTGEAVVEPEDKHSRPEALVADDQGTAHTDFLPTLLFILMELTGRQTTSNKRSDGVLRDSGDHSRVSSNHQDMKLIQFQKKRSNNGPKLQ